MLKPLCACAAASLIVAFPTAVRALTPTPPLAPTAATSMAAINPIGARLALEPVPVVDGISANGERITAATPAVSAPSAPAGKATESPIGSEPAQVELDRAIRRESRREQHKVARNEQRLDAIAPRTTIDRTNQMPDDAPSPALSPPDRGTIRY